MQHWSLSLKDLFFSPVVVTSQSQVKYRTRDNAGKKVCRTRLRPQTPHPPLKDSELGRLEKKRLPAFALADLQV